MLLETERLQIRYITENDWQSVKKKVLDCKVT